MKNAILVLVLTAVLTVSAAAVYAGAPLNGTWKSTIGQFDEGTLTTNDLFLAYNAFIYGQSFAGGVFTDDWSFCVRGIGVGVIVPKFGPTGNETYQFTYDTSDGGYLKLGGPGNPWNGGDAVYIGIIDSFVEIRTVQWVNNVIVGSVSDWAISAHIQGYPESCVSWAIGNGVLRGAHDGDTYAFAHPPLQVNKGTDYPGFPGAFFGPECDSRSDSYPYPGHWDDIRDLTISITGCTVATDPTTWGAVKAMYRK